MALAQEIIDQIEKISKARENRKTPAEKDPRFKFRGTRVPILRSIFKEHKKEFLALTEKQQIKLIDKLMKKGMSEEILIAINFMGCIPNYFSEEKMPQLDKWISGLYSWSGIDHMAIELIQLLIYQDWPLMKRQLKEWATSENYWKRRLAAASFCRRIAKEKEYRTTGLQICEQLALDEEDMVRKGVGWALQDMMRHDDPRVLKLLKKLRKKGASSTVILYALRKVPKSVKEEVLAIPNK